MLKICGIKDGYFASRAAMVGVEYLGFIFSSKSPRGIKPDKAAEIVASVRYRASPYMVGVFTPRPVADILRISDQVGFDVVQLHGRYVPADVAAVKASGREVWLLDDGGDPCATVADGILIDGVKGEQLGGTGVRSDWSRVAVRAGFRLITSPKPTRLAPTCLTSTVHLKPLPARNPSTS